MQFEPIHILTCKIRRTFEIKDRLEKSINALFNNNDGYLKLKRIENPHYLEWDIEGGHGCTLSYFDQKFTVSNANGNFLEFIEFSDQLIIPCTLKEFSECTFNISCHTFKFKVYCDGYVINFKPKKHLPQQDKINIMLEKADQNIHYEFNNGLLEEIHLFSNQLTITQHGQFKYNFKEICEMTKKSFEQFLEKIEIIDDLNTRPYISTSSFNRNHKYGLCLTMKYTPAFSKLIAILNKDNKIHGYFVSGLCNYLIQCEKLLVEGLDTNDTCSIYYKYLDIIKEIKESENALQIAQERKKYNAMVLEAIERFRKAKEDTREKKKKEQEEAILLLEDISNDEEMLKIFLDIYEIDRKTFNKKYVNLDPKYVCLSNALYNMDKDTREFLLLVNDIYN